MPLEAISLGAGSYPNPVELDRRLVARLFNGKTGSITGFIATAAAAGLSLRMSEGEALVRGRSSPTTQGAYYVSNAAIENIPLAVPAASPRIDAVVLAVGDLQYGALGPGMADTQGPRWLVVQGVPDAAPVAPTDATIQDQVGAGGWERWRNVRVDPGNVNVNPANITAPPPSAVTPLDEGAWTAYTPTMTGFTRGNGVLVGRYRRDGDTVHWTVEYTVGSTDQKGTAPRWQLPFPPRYAYSTGNYFPMGSAYLRDVSAGTNRVWTVCLVGNQTVVPLDANADGVNVSVPWTWATGDRVIMHGVYEAEHVAA